MTVYLPDTFDPVSVHDAGLPPRCPDAMSGQARDNLHPHRVLSTSASPSTWTVGSPQLDPHSSGAATRVARASEAFPLVAPQIQLAPPLALSTTDIASAQLTFHYLPHRPSPGLHPDFHFPPPCISRPTRPLHSSPTPPLPTLIAPRPSPSLKNSLTTPRSHHPLPVRPTGSHRCHRDTRRSDIKSTRLRVQVRNHSRIHIHRDSHPRHRDIIHRVGTRTEEQAQEAQARSHIRGSHPSRPRSRGSRGHLRRAR